MKHNHATRRWHNPWATGPRVYESFSGPTLYRGFQIFHRIPGLRSWDVVRGNVAWTQRAGFNGAKRAIDAYLDHDERSPIGLDYQEARQEA